MAGWIPPGDFYRRDGDTGIAEVGNGGKTGNPFSRSAGQTWNRMYPGGTSVESFSEIERAHVHKQRPENRGVFHASLMDKNQTREVRGHPEGELSVFYTSPRFNGTGGRFGIDHAEARRPVPVPMVRREGLMYRQQVESQQWQISDSARGTLPKCGGPRNRSPRNRETGVPAFWRSHASRPYSIEELTRRSRTNVGRRALAHEASFSSSARGSSISKSVVLDEIVAGPESRTLSYSTYREVIQ